MAKPEAGGNPSPEEDPRFKLAKLITQSSLGIILLIVIAMLVAILLGRDLTKMQVILTSILPLLGTWIGTVLAYYFAKDNFEAAAKHEQQRLALQSKPHSPLAFPAAPTGFGCQRPSGVYDPQKQCGRV